MGARASEVLMEGSVLPSTRGLLLKSQPTPLRPPHLRQPCSLQGLLTETCLPKLGPEDHRTRGWRGELHRGRGVHLTQALLAVPLSPPED